MSGIFGVFRKNGAPLEQQTLAQIADVMKRWGADGRGIWLEGCVGLGHLMLHNTPESLHETLPLIHPAYPHLVITATARIDNRSELFEQWGIPGAERVTMTDSEVLLHAFVRWGTDCPKYLLGDYAFVIWDRQRQQLFCVRDHMGICPFYYHETEEVFIFASDIKGVLAVEGVPYRVDEEALFAARYFGSRDLKERTPLYDVRKLPPAATLTLSRLQRQQQCYWRPEDAPMLPKMSLDDYAEQLRYHLNRSIASCIRSAFPIGSHLSGGLDSSSITVLANRQLRAHGKELAATFSWSPPPKPEEYPLQDERALVEEVCRQERLQCHFAQTTDESIALVNKRNPCTEPTETLRFEAAIAPIVTAKKIRVMLSGWGGDEVVTFNGRGYLAELFFNGKWLHLANMLKARNAQPRQWLSIAKSEIILPALPDVIYSRAYSHPVARRLTNVSQKERRLIQRNLSRFRSANGVRKTKLGLLNNRHITHRIESWADFAADNNLDYRYPLLDRRLLDYCLGVTAETTVQQGWKRYLFRFALQNHLPPPVTWKLSKHDPAYTSLFETT